MSDSVFRDFREENTNKTLSTGFSHQAVYEGLPAGFPDRLSAEPGPPPTVQPGSNRGKFPDTRGPNPWWPVDRAGPHGPDWPYSKEDAPGGWGVHWAELSPIDLSGPLPYIPPAAPRPIPDGPVYKAEPIQPSCLSNEAARQSVNNNADADSIYFTAGLTGAGLTTGVHFSDVYTGSIAPEQRTGAVAFWRNNLSPSGALACRNGCDRLAGRQSLETPG